MWIAPPRRQEVPAMRRFAPLALLLFATAARANRIADYAPEIRAAIADVTVIGTVTEIGKNPVLAKPYPTAPEPIPFAVAVVKVESNVFGAKNVTHVRVGFIPAPAMPRTLQPSLKVGQKVCLFLTKHPDATFYLMPVMSPPLEVTDASKDTLARVKRLGPVFAQPLVALKAEKADDRAFAAAALLTRYRQVRFGGVTKQVPIPAEETQAILAALADSEWTAFGTFSSATAVSLLGLSKANGYAPRQPKPGEDALKLMRAEFKRWVAAEGKTFEVKKLVPTTK